MKKKLITLLTLLCVVCCALWLVACDKDTDVEVTGVELDITQITLTKGEHLLLTATITPSNATNQKIEWTSANHSVAVVEDGYVVTFGEGTTTITAKSSNGKTATCAVTVEASQDNPYVMQYDVKFDPNGGKFADGSTEPIEKTVNWGDHLNPVTVTRDGKYEFAGWYRKGQPATGAWDFDSHGVFDDTTLYASWKYLNSFEAIMVALEDRISDDYQKQNKENVEVDILSIYKDEDGYLCFIEKDRYGVNTYKTGISDFKEITADVVAQVPDTTLTEIDSYNYEYNSDNNSYIADYLPPKYPVKDPTVDTYEHPENKIVCSVIYACVTDWTYYFDDYYTQAKGPYYSCEVKALMVDEDGKVFTYTATIVSATTNFNFVMGGSFLSQDINAVITPLGDLANDYYSEYHLDKEASIYE